MKRIYDMNKARRIFADAFINEIDKHIKGTFDFAVDAECSTPWQVCDFNDRAWTTEGKMIDEGRASARRHAKEIDQLLYEYACAIGTSTRAWETEEQ